MEEILSPSENKDTEPRESTPPRFDGETGGGKRSRKTSAGEGQSLPDKRESDSVSGWQQCSCTYLPAVPVTLYIVYHVTCISRDHFYVVLYQSVCTSVCLSVQPSLCWYIRLFVHPCLSKHLSVCWYIHVCWYTICLSVHPSVSQYIHLSVGTPMCVGTSICLLVHLSVCLYIQLSFDTSICLLVHPSVSQYICLLIHPSVYQYIHLSVGTSALNSFDGLIFSINQY